MKLQSITISNFRGFPYEETIYLGGKNLLVYGENGSGKSSIYHAVKGILTNFSDAKESARILGEYRNVFLQSPSQKVAVQIEGDPTEIAWIPTGHPTQRFGISSPNFGFSEILLAASAVRSCLDYRALLDTNYTQSGEPNLFDIAIGDLLADFNVSVDGRWTTIGRLWKNVRDAQPEKVARDRDARESEGLDEIRKACEVFNEKFAEALESLREKATYLLDKMGQGGMEIQSFRFAKLSFEPNIYKSERGIKGRELTVNLGFRGQRIEKSQFFLNEARLSALAISIYLAGRLSCLPTHDSYRNDREPPLKLMVLDDLLVGLDYANRLPLLQILEQEFDDWQILLLTHDRVWFEMARFEIKSTGEWNCLEILESNTLQQDEDGNPVIDAAGMQVWIPVPRIYDDHYTSLDLPKSLLAHAERFLKRGYLPAAANYVRGAYEAVLKTTCNEFGIPVPYKVDSRTVPSNTFHEAVVAWLKTKPAQQTEHLKEAMIEAEMYRTIVLNPYSHSLPWKLTKAELENAMRAVRRLQGLRRAGESMNPRRLEDIRTILSEVAPSIDELTKALTLLRSVLQSRLSTFCREKVSVKYSAKNPSVGELWSALKSLGPEKPVAVAELLMDLVKMDTLEKWLIREPPMEELDKAVAEELLRLISPAGGGTLVFDT